MFGSRGCWSSCSLGLSMAEVGEAVVESSYREKQEKQIQIPKVLPSSITPWL